MTLPRKILLSLLCLTALLFWRVVLFDYVHFDDDVYVFENPHIQHGLTWEGVQWAFSAELMNESPNADYWQPVTFLSRMVDTQLFGLNPAGHHGMNLLFHLINTALVFLIFLNTTRAVWRSTLLAALFAWHPLQVEPVAWITARKDVLSAFFALLTIWIYTDYVKRPSIRRYIFMAAVFALGLMVKPVLVMLPFLLLLLDRWPLERIPTIGARQLLWKEKIPLFLISIPFFAIPFVGQPRALAYGPFSVAIGNGVTSYVFYLKKFFVPVNLGLYGQHAETGAPLWQFLAAFLALFILTIMLRDSFRQPARFVGWAWFLLVLLPAAGLIRPADRFMYFPMIGLSAGLIWSVPKRLTEKWAQKKVLMVISAVILGFCFAASWHQLPFWRSDEVLFKRAVDLDPNNYVMQNNYGIVLMKQGNLKEAAACFRKAIGQNPFYANAQNNLGFLLFNEGKVTEAMEHYFRALAADPDHVKTHVNLAGALAHANRIEEALEHFHRALRLDPEFAEAHFKLGELYDKIGKKEEAIAEFKEAVRHKPNYADAHNNLGACYADLGNHEAAIHEYEEALKIDPSHVMAHNNIGLSNAIHFKYEQALPHFLEAVRLKPDFVDAHYNLGIAYGRMGRWQEAEQEFLRTVEINPNHSGALAKLALIESMKLEAAQSAPSNPTGT